MSPGLRWPQAGHAGAALAPLEEPSTRTMPFHLPSSQHKPLHFCKGITKRRPRKIHGASSACQIKWQQLCAHKGFSEGHRHSLQPGAAHSLTSALSHLRQGPGCGHHHLHAHTHCPSSPEHGGTARAQTHLQLPGDLGTSSPDVSTRLRTRPWHPSPSQPACAL